MSDVSTAGQLPPGTDLRVLVLDDEPTLVAIFSRFLSNDHIEVLPAGSIAAAEGFLSVVTPDVAVVDVYLNNEDGIEYARELRRRYPEMGIIVISQEGTETLSNKALESGADQFLSKPIAPPALILTIRTLARAILERRRNEELEGQVRRHIQHTIFPDIVTNSDAMRAVLNLVEKVAKRDLSVLVCGESGTGKELIARAIHQSSTRSRGNYVELNCAALPPNLVESELFGHEKGAFTGAVVARKGKIQHASGGTLFLDEIGELPLEIQPKLLRALQEKRIVPVGGREPVQCDFRLISATNRDLVQEVREGRFREDLFYRVAVFPIKLPPLRDRPEDLRVLLDHFLRLEGIASPRFTAGAEALLRTYSWPGNIRELRNFSQAVMLLAEDSAIDEQAVRDYFGNRLEGLAGFAQTPAQGEHGPLDDPSRPPLPLPEVERREILHALRYYKGNVSEAARVLEMGRATLYKYIKRHNIDVNEFS